MVIKNNSQFTNFTFRNASGTVIGAAITITKGDTGFKTYYYPLTGALWTGTLDGFRLFFGSGTTVANDTMEIDQLDFVSINITPTYNNFVQNPGFDDSPLSYDGWKVAGNRPEINYSLSTTEKTTGTQSLKVNYISNAAASPNAYVFIENLNTGTFTTPYDDTAILKASMKVKLKRTGLGAGIPKVVSAQTNFRINGATNVPAASVDNSGALDTWELVEFQVGVPTGTTINNIIYRLNLIGEEFLAGDEIYIDDVKASISSSLGTTTFNKNDASIKLYPNPVKDILNISCEKPLQKISVTDMLGRVVLTPQVGTEINVSSLTKGTYILSLESENGVSTKKIIKE